MSARTIVILGGFFLLLSCICNPEEDSIESPDATAHNIQQRKANILYCQGNVQIKRDGSLEWIPAMAKVELNTNDKLRTLRDSFVTIEFDQGGTLRVGPESLVSVTDLKIEPRNQARRVTFTLMEGNVEAELNELNQPGSEFKIQTPSAETSVLQREVSFQ